MIKYWLWIVIGGITQVGFAQDLSSAIRAINPGLYLNNIDNQPVYHQTVLGSNSLVFTRLYTQAQREQKEQSYHYCFLNKRDQEWILEIRLDQHDFKISNGMDAQAIRSSDFGIAIYHFYNEKWYNVTADVLPENFVKKFKNMFPNLQVSGWGYYYYNQTPEFIIEPIVKRKILRFEQNGRRIASLVWCRERFVWKWW
jgi:hypothetical protein